MSSNQQFALIYQITQYETAPAIKFRVSSFDGADLTGGQVQFRMMNGSRAIVIDAPASIDGPNDVSYQWQSGETDIPGTYWCQIDCILSDGRRIIGPAGWQQIQIIPSIQGVVV